jgi:hypothetical protein
LTICAHFLYKCVILGSMFFGNKISSQKHTQNLKSLKRKKKFLKLHFDSS